MMILTCDKCGIGCDERSMDSALELQEFLRLDFIGGYSSVFGDQTRVKLDICQHCLKTMLGSALDKIIVFN